MTAVMELTVRRGHACVYVFAQKVHPVLVGSTCRARHRETGEWNSGSAVKGASVRWGSGRRGLPALLGKPHEMREMLDRPKAGQNGGV